MLKKLASKISKYLPHILAMLFVAGFAALAWTEPTTAPPDGNVPAPINVSSVEQIKAGNLTVNALGISAFGNALLVPNGNVGIGTDSPGAKLDVQGGDLKVGTVDIKGDSSISTNLNADKVDGKHADEISSPPGSLMGMFFAVSNFGGPPPICYSDSLCSSSPFLGYYMGTQNMVSVNVNNESVISGVCPYASNALGCTAPGAGTHYFARCAAGLLDRVYPTGYEAGDHYNVACVKP